MVAREVHVLADAVLDGFSVGSELIEVVPEDDGAVAVLEEVVDVWDLSSLYFGEV